MLSLLNVPLKTSLNVLDPCGYYFGDVEGIVQHATKIGLCVNRLSENQVIVSVKPVTLGKCKRYGRYFYQYYSTQEWLGIKLLYEKIKSVPCVPSMTFLDGNVIYTPDLNGVPLANATPTSRHKDLFLEFMRGMNATGCVHRDLHSQNIIVSEDDLWVLDWDFLTEQKCVLSRSYDVTGSGDSPHQTNNCHIFRSLPDLGIRSVAECLGITFSDILKLEQFS